MGVPPVTRNDPAKNTRLTSMYERSGLVPGSAEDRAAGWYGKAARPDRTVPDLGPAAGVSLGNIHGGSDAMKTMKAAKSGRP